MREILLLIGLFVVSALGAPAAGPMKISDNNIENIYNINIYINGVFSNNVEQDVISVLVSLLNQQSTDVSGFGGGGGKTLKEQLMDLAEKSKTKDIDINVPAGNMGQGFNFDGLATKIQEALSKSASPGESSPLMPANLEAKAKELLSQYRASGDAKL